MKALNALKRTRSAGLKRLLLATTLSMLGLLTACGDSRPLFGIQLLDGNLQPTSAVKLLDTLYLQARGLTPDETYAIELLDPNDQVIMSLRQRSDADGMIEASPVWYDVGLKRDGTPDFSEGLNLRAFTVRLRGETDGTDYRQPFYIVFSDASVSEQPQAVVWATASAQRDGGVENSFDETGTRLADGSRGRTRVYVEARSIPARIGGQNVNAVDLYVLPARAPGEAWATGDDLTGAAIVSRTNVAVSDDGNGSREFAQPVLLWDLDDPNQNGPTLINPGENDTAYDVVLDVNRNGQFDLGEDINGDGKTDRYVDAADGNSVVGFIVANTEANEFFARITDAPNGAETNSLTEDGGRLYIAFENLPAGTSSAQLTLYQRDTRIVAAGPLNLSVSTPAPPRLPYIASSLFADTLNDTIVPAGISNAATRAYDLEVSFVAANGSTPYAASITVLHPAAELVTEDGSGTARKVFDETGTSPGNTRVFARTQGLALADGQVTLRVVPHRDSWADGSDLSAALTNTTAMVSAGSGNITSAVQVWDLDVAPKLMNPAVDNRDYDLILDADNNGIFNAGVDVLAPLSFVVRDTAANNPANVFFGNIASGGNYSGNPSYDYRDVFAVNGRDTFRSYYVGYGIKASWNPYLRRRSQPAVDGSTHEVYQGQTVDVYIVDAATADLSDGALLGQGGNADVSGVVERLPVQYSCYNGAGQQLIWQPDFAAGSYYVVVDVDKDGKITADVDLVDANDESGRSVRDDGSIVGFTVR